jgi:hypothetical protein
LAKDEQMTYERYKANRKPNEQTIEAAINEQLVLIVLTFLLMG